jgi:hypothetical protein
MNAAAIAAELDDLAGRARRLPPPNHRNPDAFHEARSELAKDIAAIGKWLRTGKQD